ncbi:type I restriction-modification system endonuclease [Coraliomargarita sp. SDUM461004]|uniref:Type I restriction-modification system endonuclease n=1 Tax=Thalassobacterium sedimentorum TaxID=3041258 RepID=A0ABU1ANS9_9BACT|nr:type I restriction-modification system endonuclease [Coraliomargarita sp. SDUM461004]MDQ8196339.1 type I restriction-modification system endonuclease [Coraliomargarita sp. SDUM461004]
MSNFTFLKTHDPLFLQLATSAERVFSSDPNTTLIKLRQLGEAIAQDLATSCGIEFNEQTKQIDLIYQLGRALQLDPQIIKLFHKIRISGNDATHQFETQHKDALSGLKVARELALWYHRSSGRAAPNFKAGPFQEPADPSRTLRELKSKVQVLSAQLTESSQQLESNQSLLQLQQEEKEAYEALAEEMDAEARSYQAQSANSEAELKKQQAAFESQIQALQSELASKEAEQQKKNQEQAKIYTARVRKACKLVTLNEEMTRILIDQQLNDFGWIADSQELRYAKGARPERGKNVAIAEWPTMGRQSADYVLFAGLTPIAIVEAKRENANVAGKITQAERYSRGFQQTPTLLPAWEVEGRTIAWADDAEGHYQIPFVYSCNGRPYIKQLAEQSGIWFRDVRDPSNTRRALQEFHSPEGLLDRLTRQRATAESQLRAEGFAYLQLRDYQEKAICEVESALEDDQTSCLLAMATGTGKTRTIIGLMYRFLKAERFKRILFLVDRTALGEQAQDVFKEAPLEQNQPLSKIYNIAQLGDMAAEAETRIQVATVQAMVRRIFQSDTPPPIDQFDCIIIDEAHRGYTLDQEMTEGELEHRDAEQYLSAYRRALDYFDAIKIGLTATPAVHTSEIFGKPVYTYSYREAVADDWLIDHEPPIRYRTLLAENGIQFERGEAVEIINTQSGEVEAAELEDELGFDIEGFNRRVITKSFNQVICAELAKELDPFSDEKTMIFCATDLHADMVKNLLDEAFKDLYGSDYNEAAVRKITGKSDQVDKLIRRLKNERYPSIAITVDLLTTGIDVPKICNLVFMRLVKSRILYEQMIGRATRRCDEIGKTYFRIYDAVDIYKTLEKVNTMKPLVKDPNITLDQLVAELTDDKILEAALIQGESESESRAPASNHAQDVLDQISQKIMRVLRKANNKAERKPDLRAKLQELEAFWGVPSDKLHSHLHELGPRKASDFLKQHSGLLNQLDEVKRLVGSEHFPIISHHADEVTERSQNYGGHDKPEDYLNEFTSFINEQLNQSAALKVAVTRPRDLTREQLKEVKLLLDSAGFSEVNLQTAWRGKSNQDIAASIIGYIRQAALGEPLIPFGTRVQNTMQTIYALHDWTRVQRNWLARLAAQLTHEGIIDRDFVNQRFSDDGGSRRIDKLLDSQLDKVIESLNAHLWEAS